MCHVFESICCELFFQLAVLQAELERMKVENHRLRDMLDEVNTNYSALQMHLMNLMQEQKAKQAEEQEVFDGKLEENKKKKRKQGESVLVPRHFMDLGLATNADADGPSSSSLGRSQDRSGSPGNNNMEVASKELVTSKNGNNANVGDEGLVFDQERKEFGRGIERENSPSDQGYGANKIQRFSPPKNVDQAEATMRKARVSVRARSEAPMVCHSLFQFYNLNMIIIIIIIIVVVVVVLS